MPRPASFDRNGMKSGAWSEEEDDKLRACINRFGHPNWRLLPLVAGLKRCGKSCRLRWVNYLKPGLRRGNFTKHEEDLIIQLHNQHGSKWSPIAAYFPGRTDNDIKNYWHAHIKKRNGGGVSRSIRIRNLAPEEHSLDNNSSTITSLNQDTPASEVAFNKAAENMGVIESNAESDYNAAANLYQTSFSNFDFDHHNFVEQEFYGVGENIMSLLCDSSDWGNASWNNLTAATFQSDFWTQPVEEDILTLNFGDEK